MALSTSNKRSFVRLRTFLTLAVLTISLSSVFAPSVGASPAPVPQEERALATDLLDSLGLSGAQIDGIRDSACKCTPGEPCWPSEGQWNILKSLVGGNLIKNIPIGSPCHNPTFDQAKCDALKASWSDTLIHEAHHSSMMHPVYTNNTCNPFLPRETPCTTGFTPEYVVRAKSTEHIQAAVYFAKAFNIRLVIRNTGHDFLGRSTGFAGLSVWLKDLRGLEFSSDNKSVKIGAGVRHEELYEAVAAKKKVVVAGGCPTVAFAGGYLGGGGHSPLTPILGIAADHVTEFSVVLASGQHVKANSGSNSDLFWALKGGGAGNFGVVTSVTVKLHDDFPVSGTVLTLTSGDTDKYFQAVDFYRSQTPKYTDNGVFTYALYLPGFFRIQPFFAPKKTKAQVDALLKPLVDKLTELGISFQHEVKEFPTYREGFKGLIQPETAGAQLQMGSRLIPRAVLESNPAGVSNAVKAMLAAGSPAVEMNFGVKTRNQNLNAVNPAWQGAQLHLISGTVWPEDAAPAIVKSQRQFATNVLIQNLRNIAPNSGAHISEADVNEPDFKATFFGNKYAQLQTVKNKYDSGNVFYVPAGVNSDKFIVGETNGKLCKAGAAVKGRGKGRGRPSDD